MLPRTRESIKDVEDNTNNASLLHRTRKTPLGSSRLSERANSKLKPSEYSVPVLGLVFLLYADYKFALVSQEIAAGSSRRRTVGKTDYQALLGALFTGNCPRMII